MEISKHQKFINGLKAQFTPEDPISEIRQFINDDSSDDTAINDDLMKEIEKKFDELFGPIDSDE